MTTAVNPWAPTELVPDTKELSLVVQIRIIFEMLWDDDVDNTRRKATSTDREDADEGSPAVDKTLLAAAVKKLAQVKVAGGDLRVEELSKVHVTEIIKRLSAACRRVGVDRRAIAQAKAEYFAIQAAEAMEADEELVDGRDDGRREVGADNGFDESE